MKTEILLAGALSCACLGAISDVRTRRIPNLLTRGGLLLALLLQLILGGWRGLAAGFAGAVAAGTVFFLVYLIGGMGAGDVKLIAAIGAWVGISNALETVLAIAVSGGILGLIYVAWKGRVMRVLRNTAELVRFHMVFGITRHPEISLGDSGSIVLPYGLAIAAGTLFVALSAGTLGRG